MRATGARRTAGVWLGRRLQLLQPRGQRLQLALQSRHGLQCLQRFRRDRRFLRRRGGCLQHSLQLRQTQLERLQQLNWRYRFHRRSSIRGLRLPLPCTASNCSRAASSLRS